MIPPPPLSVESGRFPLELIREATEVLEGAQVHRPQWTAEQLLGFQLGIMPVDLYADNPPVGTRQELRFRADVAARAGGMPLQYLLGAASFYGREFSVGPGVFIPRPETEVLVDVGLDFLSDLYGTRKPSPFLIDVGTGCGILAVTLALEQPHFRIVGVDISDQALSFAEENGRRYEAEVTWVRSDLLNSFAPRSADLIVANPPYLDSETAAQWPSELAWEPWLALSGGPKGIEVIRRLMREAERVLRPGGLLVLEIAETQPDFLRTFEIPHRLQVKSVEKDLAGMDRIMVLSRG